MTQNYGQFKAKGYFKRCSDNFRGVSCELSRCESPANHKLLVYYTFSFFPGQKISLCFPDSLIVECNKVIGYWPMMHSHKWCVLLPDMIHTLLCQNLEDAEPLIDVRAIDWKYQSYLNNCKE